MAAPHSGQFWINGSSTFVLTGRIYVGEDSYLLAAMRVPKSSRSGFHDARTILYDLQESAQTSASAAVGDARA